MTVTLVDNEWPTREPCEVKLLRPLRVEDELGIARLLVAVDEMQVTHPWWCRRSVRSQCQCGLEQVRAARAAIKRSVEAVEQQQEAK